MADEHVGETLDVETAAHPPRTDSPEYLKSRAWLMGVVAGGCYICGGPVNLEHPDAPGDPKGMQDHHGGGILVNNILVGFNLFPLEWSMGWGAAPSKVDAFVQQLVDAKLVDWSDGAIATTDDVMKWVDSIYNANVKLCLVGETPVLTPSGIVPLLELGRGDYVFGHDGKPHQILDAWSKRWEGELVILDGKAMTPEHPVLIAGREWIPAASVRLGDRVLVAEMFGMASEDHEVFDAVVEPVVVDMVDPLVGFQRSPEMLLHNPTMLQDDSFGIAIPNANTAVATLVLDTVETSTRQEVQRRKPRLVSLGDLGALLRAGLVNASPAGANIERPTTNLAGLQDTFANSSLRRSWRPIRDIRRKRFNGRVYDLTVDGSHSFILANPNGMAVHNCAPHHIGLETQHSPDHNGHEAVGIHNGPWPILAAQATWDWTKGDMWGGSTGTVAVSPRADGTAMVMHVAPSHPGNLKVGQVLPATHPHARAARTPVDTGD